MKFSFSGRHMEVGESLSNKAKEACKNLANKYGTEFIDVSIVMKKDNYLFHTDISVKSSSGNSYMVSNKADDPIVSFDGVMQRLDAQMRKKKNSGRTTSLKKLSNISESLIKNTKEEDEDTRIIIAEVLDELCMMSVREAAEKLNQKRCVFVFRNISNNAVNVVYLREDRNIGWIDYKDR